LPREGRCRSTRCSERRCGTGSENRSALSLTSDAQPAGVAAGTDADANLRVLATLPLFADVADGELETLARVTRLVEAPAGTVLWREGDEADRLHVVVSGAVSIEPRRP